MACAPTLAGLQGGKQVSADRFQLLGNHTEACCTPWCLFKDSTQELGLDTLPKREKETKTKLRIVDSFLIWVGQAGRWLLPLN